MPVESVKRTIIVALGICILCSVLVSTAAVSLRGIQEEKRRLDRIGNILTAVDIPLEGADIRRIFDERIQPVVIDLASGGEAMDSRIRGLATSEDFDIQTLAGDPEYGREVPRDRDMAGIRRMPKYMVIYLMQGNGGVEKVILPVYGKGLWSTMYGFIALGSDLTTIQGFTFYAHGETPGLGGEVDNPRWKNIWKGKQAFDAKGDLKIEVVKGVVNASKEEAKYQIDGLSGATWTTLGVDRLVRFWLGDDGYGPLIKRLREELHGEV